MDACLSSYRRSMERVEVLRRNRETLGKATERDIHNLRYGEYADRIRAIEEERDGKIRAIEEDRDRSYIELDSDIQRAMEIVQAGRRVLKLMEISEEGRGLKDLEAYYYSQRTRVTFEPVEVLYSDAYKRVSVYIVENKKPTNCYSLVVLGASIFYRVDDRLLPSLGHDYLNGVNFTDDFRMVVREGSNREKLLAWYKAHGLPAQFKDFIGLHEQVEREYCRAVELFKDRDWLRLYLEYRQDIYEHHYSGGTSTPEYAEVMRRLGEL